MPPITRYAKLVAHPGQGDALASVLLEAAEALRSHPGCDLYLVNRTPGEPDVVRVTELWRDEAALQAGAPSPEDPLVVRAMELIAEGEQLDLEPVGGVGLPARPQDGWTLRHLPEEHDDAADFGIGEQQEARFPREQLGLERTGLSLHNVKPGQRQPFGHRHANAEETYVVTGGSGTARIEDEDVELRSGDALRVAPGLARAFQAGPDGLDVLAFGPRHEGDGDVLPGWWGS